MQKTLKASSMKLALSRASLYEARKFFASLSRAKDQRTVKRLLKNCTSDEIASLSRAVGSLLVLATVKIDDGLKGKLNKLRKSARKRVRKVIGSRRKLGVFLRQSADYQKSVLSLLSPLLSSVARMFVEPE